ncbi:MAG: methyltransferase domain-containing protein, partial [Planctomycetaceae bacterium]
LTMWNALEHVHQPRETVRAAAAALRRGGLLVIGVPNFDSWSFEKFQHHWHGLELPRHLTHFTPQTLCELLAREGLRVLSMQHVARVGWVRRSARRAQASGWGTAALHACRFKPIGLRVADWTERRRRGDFIRAIAEKP